LSLRLYFLRHGETTFSTTGAFCGDLDPELTAEGVQMARAFAAAYRSIPWTAAYVSPMKRTIATAKPLCDAVGLEIQLRDGLKEIRYGKC
jgi:broad specificity phosphatase PhoE